jgi:formylglycine-generating enzyme required for sulfatase activity
LAQFFKREGPRHKVSIARPFAVGRTHITRGEFAAFVTATGHRTDGGCYSHDGKKWKLDPARSWRSPGFEQTDAHPVVCVNWSDAEAYAAWLSQRTGKSYRLMSEAEAEYVTRATTQATRQPRFFFGNDYKDLCTHGNGADLTAKEKFSGWNVADCRDGYVYTAPVASFKANAWGLHDVHGNAWSWTADCFVDSYNGAPSDGSARTTGNCVSRVLRGGSWDADPQYLRAANRNLSPPDYRDDIIGFRLARTLFPSP